MDKPFLPLLIIADDTTGALDTGVQFTKRGFSTVVIPNNQLPVQEVKENLQVLVVDTNTRNVSPEEAYHRVKEVVKLVLTQFEVQSFYKKTDSTLRGNIGKEFEALLDATGRRELFFVPAFPGMGRITRGGHQLVRGEPASQTELAQDILNPVRENYIPELIHKQSSLSVEVVDKNRRNVFWQYTSKRYTSRKDRKVIVFDAENEQDLKEIGLLLQRENKIFLTAGCAGFAEHLAQLLNLQPAEKIVFTPPSRWLVIGGSLHPLALEQLDFAAQKGIPQVILSPAFFFEDNIEDFFQEAWYYLQRDFNFIIRTIKSREDLREYRELAEKQGWNWKEVPLLVSQKLGNLVKELIKKRGKKRTIIVLGGDTTRGILESFDWKGIIPERELLPGAVLSRVIGEEEVCLITKAGAFGDRETLVKLIDFVGEEQQCLSE